MRMQRKKQMIDFRLADSKHYRAAKNIQPGEALRFSAEPDNEYDPNAIAVYRRGQQVGYVPTDMTDKIKPGMVGFVAGRIASEIICIECLTQEQYDERIEAREEEDLWR